MTEQRRWDVFPDVQRLQAGKLKADVFSDLRTSGGTLSVFDVTQQVEVDRITVAMAAKRTSVQHVDYVIFEDSVLEHLGLLARSAPGETPDQAVNGVHYNIVDLTADGLLALAHSISVVEQARLDKKSVKRKLIKGVSDGLLGRKFFSRELMADLKLRSEDFKID